MKYLDGKGNKHKRLIGAYVSDVKTFCSVKTKDIVSTVSGKNIIKDTKPASAIRVITLVNPEPRYGEKLIMNSAYGVNSTRVDAVQKIVEHSISQQADILDTIKADESIIQNITATALSDIDGESIEDQGELESKVGSIVMAFLDGFTKKFRNKNDQGGT